MNCDVLRDWQCICFAAALAFALIGCEKRTSDTSPDVPNQHLPDIVVNGTAFPTKNLAQIKTGSNAKLTGGIQNLVVNVDQEAGVVDLIQHNGEIVRVSPDGSFITIPAEMTH
jgi:hypothetical protein